ncbi:hypothetical protein Tco_0513870 [Tanacetum coccineum]
MLRKQHKVDDSHYDMPLIYYTKGHSLHFGRLEFALIIGLPFGTIYFGLYTSGELKFHNRVFQHKLGLSVTNLDVIGVIEDEETFWKLCDQDSIRLCLILSLEVIFMGRLLTCPVDDTLLWLVENLEYWNCFPWGKPFKDILFAFLRHLKDAIVDGLMTLELYQEHLAGLKSRYSKDLIVFTFLQRSQGQLLISDLLKEYESSGKEDEVGRREDVADCGVWLTDDIEQFLGQPGQLKCKFPWSDDYTVDRNLWLRLVCLDPARKGWLSEDVSIDRQTLDMVGRLYVAMGDCEC